MRGGASGICRGAAVLPSNLTVEDHGHDHPENLQDDRLVIVCGVTSVSTLKNTNTENPFHAN